MWIKQGLFQATAMGRGDPEEDADRRRIDFTRRRAVRRREVQPGSARLRQEHGSPLSARLRRSSGQLRDAVQKRLFAGVDLAHLGEQTCFPFAK
jgi:hypothetical protein